MAATSFVTDTEQCCQNFLFHFFQYVLTDCKMYHSESPVRYNDMGSYGESMVAWNIHIGTVQKNKLDNAIGVLIEHT